MALEVFEITYKMALPGAHMLVTPEAPSPPRVLAHTEAGVTAVR